MTPRLRLPWQWYCWLLCMHCRFNMAFGTVLSNTTQIHEGILRYHYDTNSDHNTNTTNACSTVLLLGVGTTMTVDDYEHLAIEMVQQNPNAIVAIVDHAPGDPLKQSGEKFARLVNAVVDKWDRVFPMCFHSSNQQPPLQRAKPTVIIGGHSASGEAAIKSLLYLKGFSPSGLILLSPYRITSNLPKIQVPVLLWGFSTTTCLVEIGYAADMAYQLASADSGRVLYQLQNPSGEPRHCIFTNHGCPLCPNSSSERYAWIPLAVGESIAKFLAGIQTGTFTRESMKLSLPPAEVNRESLKLLVGNDTIQISAPAQLENAVE